MNQPSLFTEEELTKTKSLKELRNEAIKADYNEMTAKKHLDRHYVLEKLRLKYYLEVDTLWMIIFGQGYYKK